MTEKDKISQLAKKIMILSRNRLIVNFRFMDSAISRLVLEEASWVKTMSVDGGKIYYNPSYILKSYKKEKNYPARSILHMILHCVFQHFLVGRSIDHRSWNLACDIAVENMINDFAGEEFQTEKYVEQQSEAVVLKAKVNYLTAEVLYRYLKEQPLNPQEYKRLASLFTCDDHGMWQIPVEPHNESDAAKTADDDSETDILSGNKETRESLISSEELKKMWEQVAHQLQTELETFSREQSAGSKALMQNLQSVNREKCDYSSFLKKFAVLRESMQINNEEYDYIFYTYGLQLYENMPLIEPLEYKETKKIKEFVIALDTSASTSGELVQRFVQKTYTILKQQGSFYTKMNLHIIQCDSEIQEDIRITSQEEFDHYIHSMKIRGLGGTDFRPVFSYVDELIHQGELKNLRGMIYFTDGLGVFPEKQPRFPTAFVFLEDGYENPQVPVWAIKLILRSDEIQEDFE